MEKGGDGGKELPLLHALQRVIVSAEEGAISDLLHWPQQNDHQGEEEIDDYDGDIRQRSSYNVINTALVTHDSPMAAGTNHGTPLYIATVLDQPRAVGVLLNRLGADPNWVHPVHGDTCLLHASERGYTECLALLLRSSKLRDKDGFGALTKDRKVSLGQGLQQYQEGGLNALHLAALHGRLDSVKLLLDYEDEASIRETEQTIEGAATAGITWSKQTDSFDRTILQMVCDTWSMKRDESPIKASLLLVLKLLCTRLGEDYSGIIMPDTSEVWASEKRRQREIRSRCLQTDLRRRREGRMRGLRAIAKLYQPLHSEVYSPQEILKSSTLERTKDCVCEPLDGVFTFPLFTEQFCTKVWEELHHYEEAAINVRRHRTHHQQDGQGDEKGLLLPLFVRHDGNLGDLQDCGFDCMVQTLQQLCQPLVERLMPDNKDSSFEIYHAFLTRNSCDLDKTFKIHRDKSDLTFNLCLHKSEDVAGSTVGFYDDVAMKRKKDQKEAADSFSATETISENDRKHTYDHAVGRVVFHNGSRYHKTDEILRGTRGSLILWARFAK